MYWYSRDIVIKAYYSRVCCTIYILWLKGRRIKNAHKNWIADEKSNIEILKFSINPFFIRKTIVLLFNPGYECILSNYSFALVFSNGTSFCISIMLPVIFSLPFINAACGLILPMEISTMSESATVSVTSTVVPFGEPSYT